MRQDEKYWSLMPPLPSYGYGRERAGPRYGSLIHGQNLTDVVITGEVTPIKSSPNFGAFSNNFAQEFFSQFFFFYNISSILVTHGFVATEQDTMVPLMGKAIHGGQSTERIF